jgi:hypothetical protein
MNMTGTKWIHTAILFTAFAVAVWSLLIGLTPCTGQSSGSNAFFAGNPAQYNEAQQPTVTFVNSAGSTIQLSTSCSWPRPIVNLNNIVLDDISLAGHTASFSISGNVTCPIADIVADNTADIHQVNVEYRGDDGSMQSVPVNVTRSLTEPTSTLRPYAFRGTFSTTVHVPLANGDTYVDVKAVNCLGTWSCASVTIHCTSLDVAYDNNGGITGWSIDHIDNVAISSCSDPGYVNPIRAFISDSSINSSNVGGASANWLGSDFGLKIVDNQLQLDRPVMMVTCAVPSGIKNGFFREKRGIFHCTISGCKSSPPR